MQNLSLKKRVFLWYWILSFTRDILPTCNSTQWSRKVAFARPVPLAIQFFSRLLRLLLRNPEESFNWGGLIWIRCRILFSKRGQIILIYPRGCLFMNILVLISITWAQAESILFLQRIFNRSELFLYEIRRSRRFLHWDELLLLNLVIWVISNATE